MADTFTTVQTQVAVPTSAILSVASININASGDNTIITGVSNQVIRVFKIFAVAASSVLVTPKDGATALTGPMTLGSFALDFDSQPWFQTSVNNAFVLNLGTSVQVSGSVYYTQG